MGVGRGQLPGFFAGSRPPFTRRRPNRLLAFPRWGTTPLPVAGRHPAAGSGSGRPAATSVVA